MVNGSGGLNKTCKAAEVLKCNLRMRPLNSWTKRCASLMPIVGIGFIAVEEVYRYVISMPND